MAPSVGAGQDGQRMMLIISDAGLQAIGGELASIAGKQPGSSKLPRKSNKRKTASPKAKSRTSPQAFRPGTKQALLIGLLKRKSGATIDEAVEATGWQAHSVRGAISGTIKKKFRFEVASEVKKGRGRVYRIVRQS